MISHLSRRLTFGLLALTGLAFYTPVAKGQSVPPQTAIINDALAAGWKSAELEPSAKISDLQFMRRLFIDVIGRIPTVEEARNFEFDTAPGKRARLIQRLLTEKEYKIKDSFNAKETLKFKYTEEYASHWANLWTVWLMTRGGLDKMYHEQMELWLEQAFDKNMPFNEFVRALVTATGKTDENQAVNFVLSHMGEGIPNDKRSSLGQFDYVPLTSRVTRLFLGVQTQCTQCHDHPFNPEWTQENFWGVNAFFRQTTRSGTPLPAGGNAKKKGMAQQITVSDDPKVNEAMRIYYERRSAVLVSIKPTMLIDIHAKEAGPKKEVPMGTAKPRREILADYVVSHDNFAKAFVNRMWGQFFGRGLNEQPVVDDFGGHNKIVHPEMLDKLAEEFIKYKYDPKALISWICNSDAYQLSHVANKTNVKDESAPYFSRMALKSMAPEVLYESLNKATGSEDKKEEVKAGRLDFMGKLVRQFGDDEGNEQTFNGTVVQALLLMNGKEMNNDMIGRKGGLVEKMITKYKGLYASSPASFEAKIIDEIFMTALSRHASTAPTLTVEVKDAKGKVTGKKLLSESAFVLDRAAKDIRGTAASKKDIMAYKPFFEDLLWSLLNSSEFILNH